MRKPKKHVETLDEIRSAESLQFDFGTIRAATDNFSDSNKLRQGGFGAVYQGRPANGQEIAVKRLSRDSRQGGQEFKNEVLLVAKLQHRNLVRLLGFCLEGNERLLVYEFVPNASLDQFIFGMVFFLSCCLHNICQFISGCMAPEYVYHGKFSVKSDVFSFGVLVLEICSGHKNSSFHINGNAEDLLSYAWINWREETALNLIDSTLMATAHSQSSNQHQNSSPTAAWT
ncbi:unnamed protein product [Prunus armeniaca]|uniref:Protein kinase domain-containing protein n=1 Tax=Prunus armeniaca TaxID=36596 RepID=A0A6J5WWW5_PRUAR|nr:unnamed protein product [Prunus armeniaca]